MIFQPSDILWVKNVKRDNGSAWAYYEEGRDKKFKLNFSKSQVKQGALVKPGEIILLFQKVDKIKGIENRTYLTHLVTPLDNVIQINPKIEHDFKWEREVAVVARASMDNKISSTPHILSFYKPNRGKVCSVSLLNNSKSILEIQNTIWSLFTDQFLTSVETSSCEESVQSNNLYDQFYDEGKIITELKEHYKRERSAILINLAKKRAIERGILRCECCGFDFIQVYGEEFIECHHRLPIANGERESSIDDLALVCSNCHRMLHRKINNGNFHSVETLTLLLRSN